MFRQIGAPEITLILAIVILLVGSKKLPELARGTGRALRIFRSETRGLIDEESDPEPSAIGFGATELDRRNGAPLDSGFPGTARAEDESSPTAADSPPL